MREIIKIMFLEILRTTEIKMDDVQVFHVRLDLFDHLFYQIQNLFIQSTVFNFKD